MNNTLESIKAVKGGRWQIKTSSENGEQLQLTVRTLPPAVLCSLERLLRALRKELGLHEVKMPAISWPGLQEARTKGWAVKLRGTVPMGSHEATVDVKLAQRMVPEDSPTDAPSYLLRLLVLELQERVADHLQQMAGFERPVQLELFTPAPPAAMFRIDRAAAAPPRPPIH